MMKASTVCCGSSSRLRKAPRGPVLGNHADDRASDASEVRARARRRRHWRGRRRSRRGSGPRRPLPRSPPEVRFIAIALECYEWRECWAGLVAAPYPPPPRNRMNGPQPLFSQQPHHLATPYNFPRTLQLATRFRRSQTSVVPRTRGSSKPWLDDSDHALRTIHLTGQTHATCSQARLGTTDYDVATACKKAARPLGILHQTLRRLPAFDAWALPRAPPPTTTLNHSPPGR